MQFSWCCDRLMKICRMENVTILNRNNDKGEEEEEIFILNVLMQKCGYDMRRTINHLQAIIAINEGSISLEAIETFFQGGNQSDEELRKEIEHKWIQGIKDGCYTHVVNKFLYGTGYSLSWIIQQLQLYFMEQYDCGAIGNQFLMDTNMVLMEILSGMNSLSKKALLYQLCIQLDNLYTNIQ